MGRPRAGNGWSWRRIGQRNIHLIANDAGEWVPSGVASNWQRCARCRRPHEVSPFRSGVCSTCYYYKILPNEEFWMHEGDYLFPYNIGKRVIQAVISAGMNTKETCPNAVAPRP